MSALALGGVRERAWYLRWRLRRVEPPDCLGCGGPLEPQRLALAAGGWEGLRIGVSGLPVRGCGGGCRDRRAATVAGTTFERAVLEAVLAGAVVPLARRGPAGEWRCARCSSRQLAPERGEATVRGSVRLPGVEPFELAITTPAASCDSCGAVQLRPAGVFADALARALDDTWRAAGVRAGFR